MTCRNKRTPIPANDVATFTNAAAFRSMNQHLGPDVIRRLEGEPILDDPKTCKHFRQHDLDMLIAECRDCGSRINTFTKQVIS